MKLFKRTSFLKRIPYKELLISLLGLIIISGISLPLARSISKRYKVNKEIKQLQEEIGNLENKNNELKKMITYLESSEYIDEEARTGLNFKKPNEQVAVIINKEENDIKENSAEISHYKVAGDNVAKEIPKKKSNVKMWWEYFFKN